jgi:ABC-type Fe3+ transport system permease subunit
MLVFGEPYEADNGAVIVTVARTGWWRRAPRPVGLYTVAAHGTTWTPATDSSLHALIGVCTGFVAALLGAAAVLRRPPWPELTERAMVALAQRPGGDSR